MQLLQGAYTMSDDDFKALCLKIKADLQENIDNMDQ